jgi:hypothetical protein
MSKKIRVSPFWTDHLARLLITALGPTGEMEMQQPAINA